MMNANILTPGLILLLLSGCSGTTAVLVPDDSGKVGKISVQNAAGTEILSHENESIHVSASDKVPEKPEIMSKEDIKSKFANVLALQPATPLHLSIEGFASGSADVSAYTKKIKKIVDAISQRNSCDVIVIGHCDTVGTNADNEGISKMRAANVRQALIENGAPAKCFGDIRFYGESDLSYPTQDNVDEPRNRRVEVEIR